MKYAIQHLIAYIAYKYHDWNTYTLLRPEQNNMSNQ